MTHPSEHHAFYYPKVLQQIPLPAIYRKGAKLSPDLDKPDGFRIPLAYFAWGVLQGSRNLHHHPDNDEVLVVLEGQATVRLYAPGPPGDRFEGTFHVSPGDFVVFPQGWVHSVEEKGEKDSLKVLVIFNNQEFVSVEDS
ncbi:MAG: cupin domain-containing protein, partial [Holophagales bacterium]|nr:cupin domain-containing protein [Holophagales bacterium]